MDREAKRRELTELRARVRELETELAEPAERPWRATGFYGAYYATTGAMLGVIGAGASLLFNIIGSLLYTQMTGDPQHPLKLIQVYLTFPMGKQALELDNGLALAIGCCLYLGTGMLYGALFQVVLARLGAEAGFGRRLGMALVLGLLLWAVNFYGILSWLQPALFGGNWILEEIPWWVAALTHLVFAATMVVVYPWGEYVPYRSPVEEPAAA